jgi:hypothetical protein
MEYEFGGCRKRRAVIVSPSELWLRYTNDCDRAAELAAKRNEEPLARKLVADGKWDPFAFVDLCQSVARGQTAARELCLDIQQAEWELLFDYCYREAVGK